MTRRRAKSRKGATEAALAVTCPVCSAGPTVPCAGSTGPHHRRTQLAAGLGLPS